MGGGSGIVLQDVAFEGDVRFCGTDRFCLSIVFALRIPDALMTDIFEKPLRVACGRRPVPFGMALPGVPGGSGPQPVKSLREFRRVTDLCRSGSVADGFPKR